MGTKYKIVDTTKKPTPPKYKVIKSIKEITLDNSICIDFEAGSDDKDIPAYRWSSDKTYLMMLAITTDYQDNYILPLHSHYGYDLPTKKDLKELASICADPDIIKIGHNFKYDMHVMEKLYQKEIKWVSKSIHDTMIMGHLIDNNHLKTLKEWVRTYFPKYANYEDGIKYNLNTPFKDMADYAITDSYHTALLEDEFYTYLEKVPKLFNHFKNYDQPSLLSLFIAERNGALIDPTMIDAWINKAEKYLENKSKILHKLPEVERFIHFKNKWKNKLEIEILKAKMEKHKEGGVHHTNYTNRISDINSGKLNLYTEVNFNSPQQVSELLYTKEGFNFKGEGTDVDVLKEIDNVFSNHLLDIRSVEKMNGTYYKGIKKTLTSANKLHTGFNLAGTATGRLSSSDPNLQNIPKHVKREELRPFIKAVRSFFVAPEGYYFVQADYSQAELRLVANVSQDENMINAYLNDIDIHARTGALFAGMEYNKFLKSDIYGDYRQIAKSANFGLIYTMQVDGYIDYVYSNIGKRLTKKEASSQINKFFDAYPSLKRWHWASIRKAKKLGYAETLFGRRIYLPDINNENDWGKKSYDERVAINAPIQGTVGEFTVWAGSFICAECYDETKYILNVHDSCNFYIKEDHLEDELKLIKDIMENLPVKEYFNCDIGPVPMKVDLEYGKSWLNMQKYKL